MSAESRRTGSTLWGRTCTHRHPWARTRSPPRAGNRCPGLGAVLVESEHPAVYCVAGRPNAIVVTVAGLRTLDEAQLAAVLTPREGTPGPVGTPDPGGYSEPRRTPAQNQSDEKGATEARRVFEVCADDVAARCHVRRAVPARCAGGAFPSRSDAADAQRRHRARRNRTRRHHIACRPPLRDPPPPPFWS